MNISCCASQGARTCWFSEVGLSRDGIREVGDHGSRNSAPLPTLLALERTIAERRRAAEGCAGACFTGQALHGGVVTLNVTAVHLTGIGYEQSSTSMRFVYRARAQMKSTIALLCSNMLPTGHMCVPAPGGRSWTAKLLADPALCCAKVREEAAELAATWEGGEGPERAASEAADLLYHSLVLLNSQVRTGPLVEWQRRLVHQH